jgi:transcriptional regulator with XRE-family HTH domain
MPKRHGLTTQEVVDHFRADPAFARAWELEEAKAILAANIAILRHQRGLTQKQLAAAAGMRQPRVAELEHGASNPQLDTLVRVASALEVGVSDLVRKHEEDVTVHVTVKQLPASARYEAAVHWEGWVEQTATQHLSASHAAVNDNFALNA